MLGVVYMVNHLEGINLLFRSEMKIQTRRLTHDVRSGELSRGGSCARKRGD